ncbi:hypothetical protein Tco_1266609 [Tanacetum coccineum]
MTHSTVKRLTEPLDEPEREFQRLRRNALRSHQNDSLAITERNLFDDEASSSNNTRPKSPTSPKTLYTSALRDLILRFKQGDDETIKSAWIRFQDLINQVPHHGIQKWILVQISHDNISQDDRRKLDQFTQFRFHSLIEEEGWIRIKEYVQYQDDLWDEPSSCRNVSSLSEAMQPTLRAHLKRPANECELNNPSEKVCLSGGDIYNDLSLMRFYQNDNTSS